MRSPSPVPGTAARESDGSAADARPSPAPDVGERADDNRGHAAQGPTPQPVSAAENPAPAPRAVDSPAEAQGRRILSTAFVMLGAGATLTVELHDGRVLVLRDVVMRRRDYCGLQVPGGRYCGGYADVASARPGGAPAAQAPAPAASRSSRNNP